MLSAPLVPQSYLKNLLAMPSKSSATLPSPSASSIGASIPSIPAAPLAVGCARASAVCLLSDPITIVATIGNMLLRMSLPIPVCSEALWAVARLTSIVNRPFVPKVPLPDDSAWNQGTEAALDWFAEHPEGLKPKTLAAEDLARMGLAGQNFDVVATYIPDVDQNVLVGADAVEKVKPIFA